MTAQHATPHSFRRRPSPSSAPIASNATASRVEDPYHWLKDQSYPTVDDEDVLAYLRAENAYFEAAMAPHQPLIETLFQEMRGRIQEDDSSVPVRDGDWIYWWAFQPGAQYRTWYRRPVAGGDRADRLRRAGRGRGQAIFPPRRDRGQPRRPLRRDPGRRRRLGAFRRCASASSPPAATSRRSPRSASASRSGPATAAASSSPRSTRIGAATAPGCTGSASRWRTTSRSTRRPRISPSRSASAAPRTAASSSSAPARTARTRSASSPPTDPQRRSMLIAPRRPNIQYSVDSAHGRLWILTNDDHVNFRLAEADAGAAGRMANGDRRLGPGLSARHHRLSRPSRHHRAGRRPRPDPAARLRRRRAAHPLRRGELHGEPRQQPRICARRLPAQLQLDGHAADGLRLSSGRPPARDAQGPAHPVGLRSEPLRHRADHGAGARRPADPGLDRLPARLRAQRPGPALPLRLRRLRHRDAAELQHQPLLACSTAATPSPSPISAAATSSATNGISTASSTGGPTRSTISSTPPAA